MSNNQYTWIGLNDRVTEDSWLWVSDGSAPTYENWNGGTSPASSATRNCVFFDDAGKWLDESCTATARFWCMKT